MIWKAIFLFVWLAANGLAADIMISGRGPYTDLARSAAWGATGRTGVENAYILQPLSPSQGICLFVANNNPTSAHSFRLRVFQTGDTRQAAYTNATGRWVEDTVQGLPTTVPAAAMVVGYVHTTAAARIAVVIDNTSAAAGSPDTADVFLVQTEAGACGPVDRGSNLQIVEGLTQTGSLPDRDYPVLAGFRAYNGTVTSLNLGYGGQIRVYENPVCGSRFLNNTFGQLPTSASTLIAGESDSCLSTLWLYNSSSSDRTVTIDNGSTAVTVLPLSAGQTLYIKADIALSTIRWYASGSGVYGQVFIRYSPAVP